MAVLTVILGAAMAAFGVTCMFTPAETYMELGYFLGIMLLVYAASGIGKVIVQKAASVLEIILYLAALVLGIIALVHGAGLIFEAFFLYIIAIWFIFQGIVSAVIAVRRRSIYKRWYFGLAAGLFGIVVGIIAIFHPVTLAMAIGVLLGLFFLVTGVNTISIGIAGDTEDR